MVDRFSRFAAYHPKTIMIVAVVLLLPSIFGIISAKINYDILSYLPEELDSVKGEVILDSVFGNASNAFLIVDEFKPSAAAELKKKISGIDGIRDVIWIDSFLDLNIPQSIFPDMIKEIFYSKDEKSTLMMIRFEESSAAESTMNAVENIKSIMNSKTYLSGMSVLLSDTKSVVENEVPIYIASAAVLAVIVLIISMQSVSLPLIIIASIGFSVIYNMGTNFFGNISYITQSIAAILQIGVTMDYSVFLTDRYIEELKNEPNKNEAMARAVSKTFFSAFGSSMTTLFGFLALCFMSFTLGADLGFVMAKGVLLGVLSALLLLPSMLLLFYENRKKKKIENFIPDFSRISLFSVRHKKTFSAVFLILIIVSYFLKNNVDVYYNFIKALPQEMTSVAALSKLKNDYNMVTTHFVVFDDGISAYNAAKMATDFEKTEGVTSVLSLNSIIGPAIPEDMIPETVKEICIKDGYKLMMVNSSYASSTPEANLQAERLTEILKSYDENGLITGEAMLSKDLAEVTSRDFTVTGIISVAAVFAVIAALFKSPLISLLLVSTVELAVFINEAIPFFTGEEIPFIAPTVIGCVQLGATVDYAILMTTRFKEELNKGKTSFRALKDAGASSCRAILQSAFVLFGATFGMYCVCNVNLIKSICLMLSRGAIISAAVIIVFLPALLYLFEPILSKKSRVK